MSKLIAIVCTATALTTFGIAAPPEAEACGMIMFDPPDRSSPPLLVARAKKLESQDRAYEALRLYERVMGDESARRTIRSQAAWNGWRIYTTQGDLRSADARLDLALSLNPTNARAVLAHGQRLIGESPVDASVTIQRAMLLGLRHRELASANALLSITHARLGDRRAATRHLLLAEEGLAPEKLVARARLELDPTAGQAIAAAQW